MITTKELFSRCMREAWLLGLNDGWEIDFNELRDKYLRELEKLELAKELKNG